ncbi:AfsR/SARP family transcriptional regulator [Streptacidiphilus sp. PAMC 29251]
MSANGIPTGSMESVRFGRHGDVFSASHALVRDAPRLEIRMLGPLVLLGRAKAPTQIAPKPRVVLALLAARMDRAVSSAALIEELWGESPPKSAVSTLQTYIGQLRRVLVAAGGLSLAEIAERVLVSEGGGYRLSSALVALDSTAYTRLDRGGRAAIQDGSLQEGRRMLAQAMEFWRGCPLVNVSCGRRLESLVARLEEERLGTVEAALVADLDAGEHRSVIGQLTELSAQYPLHETLCGHLMLALYRCGRRAEALSAFREFRIRLVRELGLEPGERLTQLQASILRGDASLEPNRRLPAQRFAS